MSIRDRINALANAISIADQHHLFDTEDLEAAIDKTSNRLGYGDEFCVIAIAGTTGSGKSALLNAIGKFEQTKPKDIVETGETRPYTTQSQAAIFTLPHAVPEGILEWMGVSKRIVCPPGSLRKLIIVDLPDFDSIKTSHHEQVHKILALADGIIWVTDPQKYGDMSLHKGMLQSMVGYQKVMRFVLNKIDTVTLRDIQPIHKHWVDLLRADGFVNPRSYAVSATTGKGMDELFAMIVEMGQHREIMVDRLNTDLDRALDTIPHDFMLLSLSTSSLEQDLVDIINLDHIREYSEKKIFYHYIKKVGTPPARWWMHYNKYTERLRLDTTDIPVQLITRIERDWIARTHTSINHLPERVQETLHESARPIAVGLERMQGRVRQLQPAYTQAWRAAHMLQDLVSGMFVVSMLWMVLLQVLSNVSYISSKALENFYFIVNGFPLWLWIALYAMLTSLLIHGMASIFAKVTARIYAGRVQTQLLDDTRELVEKHVSVPLAVYSYAQHECLSLLTEAGLRDVAPEARAPIPNKLLPMRHRV